MQYSAGKQLIGISMVTELATNFGYLSLGCTPGRVASRRYAQYTWIVSLSQGASSGGQREDKNAHIFTTEVIFSTITFQ